MRDTQLSQNEPILKTPGKQISRELVDDTLGCYLDRLFYYSLKRTNNRQDAEDLTQEIVAEIYRSFSMVRESRAFIGWMWAVARHTYARRANRNRQELISFTQGTAILDTYTSHYLTPEDLCIDADQLNRLHREISLLSKEYRDIIVAFYLFEQSHNEITLALGIPISTVKWRLHEARGKIRTGMEQVRTMGEKSFAPMRLLTGTNGNWAPNKLFDGLLEQNIALAAREPIALEDLSLELGVARVYLEDIVNRLVSGEVMRKIGPNKYQVDFIIFPQELATRIVPRIEQCGVDLAPQVLAGLTDIENEIRATGFTGSDLPWEELLWTLIPLVLFGITKGVDAEFAGWNDWNNAPRHGDGTKGWFLGWENCYPGACMNQSITGFSAQSYGQIRHVNYWSGEFRGWIPMLQLEELEFCARFLNEGLNVKAFDETAHEQAAKLISRGVLCKDGELCRLNLPSFDKPEYDQVESLVKQTGTPFIPQIRELYHLIREELYRTVHANLHAQVDQLAWGLTVNVCAYILITLVAKQILVVPEDFATSPKGMYLYVERGPER